MRMPVIRSLTEYILENQLSDVEKTAEVLEYLSQTRGLKEEELDVIGELLSNLFGSVEVAKEVQSGKNQKDALNDFMKRVMGSIDRSI